MGIERWASSIRSPAAWGLGICLVATLPLVTQLDSGPEALRGLHGVGILVEETAPELAPLGITANGLERHVSESLRGLGVTVLERADALSDPRQPLLVIRLHSLKLPTSRQTIAWVLTLGVHRRMATLGGAPDTVEVQAWAATQVLGVNGADRLRASVWRSVDQKITEFLVAWKSRER